MVELKKEIARYKRAAKHPDLLHTGGAVFVPSLNIGGGSGPSLAALGTFALRHRLAMSQVRSVFGYAVSSGSALLTSAI